MKADMENRLTIGGLARRGRVNVQTVRYYERRGLLSTTQRSEAGYRLYGPEASHALRFIRNAQSLGFTLTEISDLLRLRIGRGTRCGQVKRRAETRLKVVRGKIAVLKGMERALKRLVATCTRRGTSPECPILECLEENHETNG